MLRRADAFRLALQSLLSQRRRSLLICLATGIGVAAVVMLTALGDVARAKGMTSLARDTGLGRENLYKALSARANPRIETIFRVASALGVRFEVRVA